MKKITGFIVTAGHFDIEWYQPMHSYRFWTTQALERLKVLRGTRDDFKTYVLDGQYYPLKEYLDVAPEDEDVMRAMIREGLLTVGPFYTQFDEWLPSAEAMIRNCLYGEAACRRMGGWMRAGYLPDNFGHPRQLPQILRGFGIDSLLFMRGMPEIPGGHEDEFTYVGLDGSEIFCSHFRESYAGAFDLFGKHVLPVQPREVPYYADYLSYEHHTELADHDDPARIANSMIANVRRIAERYPSRVIPLIAGYDHLPPQINIGDSVRLANELQDEIEFVMGDAEEYVRAAQSALGGKPLLRYGEELIGSRYQYILFGALSSRSYLKRAHFACETLLERYAEPADALATLFGWPLKQRLADEAWDAVMVNSAHDSIHGSSVDEVHVEMEARYGAARQLAAGTIHDAMTFLGARLPAWGGKNEEILAFSPAGGKNRLAEVWLPVHDDPAYAGRTVALDEQGRRLPTQTVARPPVEHNGKGQPRNWGDPDGVFEKVLFLDEYEPYALRRYRAVPDTEPETDDGALTAGENFLENEFLRAEVCGALVTLTDKRTGFAFRSLNLLEEEADAGDAWDFASPWTPGEVVRSTRFPFTCELRERGPVRAVLAVRGSMSVPRELVGDERSEARTELPVVFELTLLRGVPRLDVRCTIENTAKDHRIRLRIPSPVKTDFVRSQGHLAILDRPVARPAEIEKWRQPPTRLLPFREWLAVQDGENGLAVAFKGMYDYEAIADPVRRAPDVCVTLLRGFDVMSRIHMDTRDGAASGAFYTPDAQCPGEQVMEWSYIPYSLAEFPADSAPFLAEAQAFLTPPVTHAIRAPHAPAGDADGDLTAAPFSVAEENIRFSAFKPAFPKDGADPRRTFVLRLYEDRGRETEAVVRLHPAFRSVRLAEMNETPLRELPLDGNAVTLSFAPYKAVTLLLTI